MPAPSPRDLHLYAHYCKLSTDAGATEAEKKEARKRVARLEREFPDIGVRTKVAQEADPLAFFSALWDVIREGFREEWAAQAAADPATRGSPGARPAKEPKPPKEPMTAAFRANDVKHLCVLTITIRNVDSTTAIPDGPAFAQSVGNLARDTVRDWLATEPAGS